MRKLKEKLATERQIERMKELGIGFDADVTLEEAAELIRPHLRPTLVMPNPIPDSAMVEFSKSDTSW